MDNRFNYNKQDYVLNYDVINVIQACNIDYNSYSDINKTLEILEWKNILDNINFKLYQNGELFFDSRFNDPNKLEFGLLKKIINLIQEELEISPLELKKFINDCNMFLKRETTKMPPELIIAQSIMLNRTQLSLSDIQNMSIKTYEKINLALDILNSL
jgi:hypothetical protein